MDSPQSDPLHILVAEDSLSARMSIVNSLSGLDVVIHEADDGAPALEYLKQETPVIDLVLSDLIMKTMDGDELCRKIRNELGRRELPVIILSSQTDKDTIIRLFKAGATDYLFKPFIPEELVARISAHLEQRRLTKILEYHIVELEDLNRMKDHFLAACSHDFRSPLQGILGYTELIMKTGSPAENHRSYLTKIMTAGKQLQDMIESLLDFSLVTQKREDVRMFPLNPADLLDNCVSTASSSAMLKNISIVQASSGTIPLIKGNTNALTRVFNNLLSNAVKFTPPGGQITLSCTHQINDNTLCVAVTDNGIGIPPDILPTIFDRYSKGSRKGTRGEKSTGLGLFITRQLVELHGGTISVDSRPNAGTCFTVTLPLS
ncbi:ATP-binding response regulator [Desulfatiferula olefinivorans]